MYNIPEELKSIYRSTSNKKPLLKQLTIEFEDIPLTITNSNLVRDSFKLTESICSSQELTFGACEASMIEFTVVDIIYDLTGKTFTVTQTIGDYSMPIGTYTVYSCTLQSDMTFKDILAFDSLVNINKDVAEWYNALTFPISVKNMRESLLTHLGINYENQTLSNDSVILEKTVLPSSLSGRDVLSRLCEINAGFGHIGRTNQFKVIQLSGLGLFPSETLYPSEDLFPSESGEYVTGGYYNIDYAEYIVEPITQVIIRQDDTDMGTSSGDGDNIYTIIGNFLLFGKSSAQLKAIADNVFLLIKNKYYRPHKTAMNALPYLEVGDTVNIITSNDSVETFIFTREITDIQEWSDYITATGPQRRSTQISPKTEMQIQKSRTLRIEKSVDQLSINMTDIEAGLQSQITQTAGQLQAEITDTKNDLQGEISLTASGLQTQITNNQNNTNSQITQLSDDVSVKVSKGDVSSQLSIEPGQVYIGSNRLVVDSANFKLDANGNAAFSGKITGGTMNINNNFTVSSEGDFYAKTARFGGIYYDVIIDSNGVYIKDIATESTVSRMYTNGLETGYIFCDGISIGGSQAITASNRSQYTYPPSSHEHSTLHASGIGKVTALGNNFRPHSDSGSGVISCGSPSYLWSQVFAASTTISSSDGNLKDVIGSISEAEKRVAKKIKSLIVKFKFKDAIQKKGNGARIHYGVIAQDVKAAFESEGLNPYEYAMFCSDTWYEVEGRDCDQDESPYTADHEGAIEVTQLGIRYEELLCFVIAAM